MADKSKHTRITAGEALASTPGILLAVPLMVAVLGFVLTYLGLTAFRTSGGHLAEEQFRIQTKVIAQSFDSALSQADPMRVRLHEIAATWKPSDDPTTHAYELSDLLVARPGVAYVSV
ncbi:MAG TPA: hypothetical protein VL400_25800, partial [Polyangiaceae bacterium]|nr:hypothetical protein [Polyangiaceae bacterium]